MSSRSNERPGHYSAEAVRRSLMHFLLGKGFSAVAAFAVLLLIVRELSVPEFAVYTSLHALALIIGLISSGGIPQALHRYLPELRTHHNNRAMYRLLVGGILLRAALYALLCLMLLPFVSTLADAFKLDQWMALVPVYFVVGFLRINSTFVAQALESLLWQRDAQYSLAIGALVRLAGTLWLLVAGDLNIEQFVLVELYSEGVGMLMLAAFIMVRYWGDRERSLGDPDVLRQDRPRYLRFAFWCYIQNLTSVLFGSAPNRLFVAYFMSAEFIAVFGVVDRLIDFARRYEPLHMFVGFVRPVLMSRYSQNADFSQLVRLGNLVLLLNYVLLLAPLAVLMVVGDEVLAWMTDGKYTGIQWLVVGFYAVLLVTSLANLLDMLVKAVEQNRVYMFSNLLLSGSLLLAIPLIEQLGLWAVALANLAGLLLSIVVITRYLALRGYDYRLDYPHTFWVLVCMALSAGCGAIAVAVGVGPIVAGGLTAATYPLLLLYLLPLAPRDRRTLQEILPPRVRRLVAALPG